MDGVTGAGKSSVLAEIRVRLPKDVEFIPESETLGDLMGQIRDSAWRAQPTFAALETITNHLERTVVANPRRNILVERFHLTAFALFPHWNYYERFDKRLRHLGAVMALLTFPREEVEERSIKRPDRDAWDSGMDAWYGSRSKAVEAATVSQEWRWEGLRRTRLPFVHIDTRNREWQRYATTILAYWMAGSL